METSNNSPGQNLNPSISSAEGSPVRTSAKPESEQVLKALVAAFGLSMPVSLGNLDPDTCSLKTSQACLFTTQCEEYSESFPDSGMMLSGEVFELQSSALPTSENESSLWAAAVANDDGKTPEAHLAMKKRMGERDGSFANRTAITSLAVKVQTWPTARREDGESCGNHPGAQDSLTGATRNWPTPLSGNQKAEDGGNGGGMPLRSEVEVWQTPATDSFRSRGGDRKDEMGLDQQARFFPTPFCNLPPDRQTLDGQPSSEPGQTSRRRLNPRFVEWLMGFPIGHTEL